MIRVFSGTSKIKFTLSVSLHKVRTLFKNVLLLHLRFREINCAFFCIEFPSVHIERKNPGRNSNVVVSLFFLLSFICHCIKLDFNLYIVLFIFCPLHHHTENQHEAFFEAYSRLHINLELEAGNEEM